MDEEKTMTYEEAKEMLRDITLDVGGTPILLHLEWLYDAGFNDDEIINMCFELGEELEEEGYHIVYNYPVRANEWNYYVFKIVDDEEEEYEDDDEEYDDEEE